METSESVHCLPSSLSAVFDSSDDDDQLNSEASQTGVVTINQAELSQDPAQADSNALMHAQLLKLSEEYREAGLTPLLTTQQLKQHFCKLPTHAHVVR